MSKVFIKTYGCALNQADSIIMRNLLTESGFEIVSDESNADIIIVNTCVVKEPTENKIIRYLEDLNKKGKRLVVTGCMTEVRSDLLKDKFTHNLVGCSNIFDIVQVCKGVKKDSLKHEEVLKLLKTRINHNPVVEIIPISEGCVGNCSYCITKLARGELRSYPLQSIIEHAESALQNGARELWLTSQDAGCYGFDTSNGLIELLKELINLPYFFKTRLGMMNPEHVFKYKKELTQVVKSSRMFKFLHLPVQSGSDEVLKLMNRGYTRTEFEKLVSYFRKRIPNLTLSTDVILGFPGESEEDFNQTVNLIKSVEPEVLNISRYWNRPGTRASGMKQVSHSIRKNRTRKVMRLHKRITNDLNQEYVGEELNVLIDEEGWGRTDSYKLVKLNGGLGEYKKVRITGFERNHLIGKEL